MSSPKHSSKNVRNDFPYSVYIKGKPAAQQPRKAPPRGEPAKALNSLDPCPKCSGSLHYYDGALGYEALRCDRCDYELDLNAAANAKATAEREAPQPAKAAQAWPEGADFTPWDMSSRDAFMRLSPIHNSELERVKEDAKNWKEEFVTESRKLERVKQQLAIAESCIKNNDAAFETVKQQRDDYEAVVIDLVRQVYCRSYKIDFSLAELTFGKDVAAIANAEKEAK